MADLIEHGLLQVERIFFEGGFDWLESGKGGVGIVPALDAELRSIDILSHLLGFEGQCEGKPSTSASLISMF